MPHLIAELDIGNVIIVVCLFALGVKYHMAYLKSEKFYKKAVKNHNRNVMMQVLRGSVRAS